MPEAKTGWTIEIGARERASTWHPIPARRPQKPSNQIRDEAKVRTMCTLRRASISGMRATAHFSATKPQL